MATHGEVSDTHSLRKRYPQTKCFSGSVQECKQVKLGACKGLIRNLGGPKRCGIGFETSRTEQLRSHNKNNTSNSSAKRFG